MGEAAEPLNIQKRRLEMDENNGAVDMEEHKQSVVNRKGLVDVFG